MVIAGMVKSSFVDYPGLVSCVFFVPGCNYDCFYCHNRRIIGGGQEEISLEYVRGFLGSRVGLLDAVVVSGGEPTLQEDLVGFLAELKRYGFRVKLDTNGSNPDAVAKVLEKGVCDYFAVDYKAPLSKYRDVCGGHVSGEDVLETIELLTDKGAAFEVRTTVFPQLSVDDLLTMANELPVVPRYVLNRYRKPEIFRSCDEERVNAPPYTQKQLDEFAKQIKPYQPNVTT